MKEHMSTRIRLNALRKNDLLPKDVQVCLIIPIDSLIFVYFNYVQVCHQDILKMYLEFKLRILLHY